MNATLHRFSRIVVLLATFSSSCMELPELGGNPLDPFSNNYVPTWPLLYGYALSPKAVQLNWIDRSLGEEGFEIVRSEWIDSGYVLIVRVPTNTTEYVDTNSAFILGKTYWYRMRAFAGSSYSQWSGEKGVKIQ